MYEMHFGVPMSGAVFNAINTRLDARTVGVLLLHSGSKLMFVDPASLPLIRDALKQLPPGHPAPRVVPVEDPHEKELPAAPAGTLTYARLLEKGDPEFAWVRPASEWDPMVLNYTSGTTSAPKGVVHCHRAIFLVTVDSLVQWAVPPQPTYLWTLPMFHTNGWSFPCSAGPEGGRAGRPIWAPRSAGPRFMHAVMHFIDCSCLYACACMLQQAAKPNIYSKQ